MPSDAPTAQDKGKNGKPSLYNDEIAKEVIDACRSGFTIEKAGGLVGLSPSTIKSWCARKPDFARKVESARKKHELSLLRDIELAGQKSWQAKAWMAERIYLYSVPSTRLQVQGSVEHGLSAGLAQILAGSLSKRIKQAQPIDAEQVADKPKILESSYNSNCATYETSKTKEIEESLGPALVDSPKRTRHVRMKRRAPRVKDRAATTTPPPAPPTP
jgi:hypothetical protein